MQLPFELPDFTVVSVYGFHSCQVFDHHLAQEAITSILTHPSHICRSFCSAKMRFL